MLTQINSLPEIYNIDQSFFSVLNFTLMEPIAKLVDPCSASKNTRLPPFTPIVL
jgi:hypothetical protein